MTCYINATDRIGNTNTVQLTNIRAEEICDDTDNDCDRDIDEGCDDDNDDYCDTEITLIEIPAACPMGGNDCDDNDASIIPAGDNLNVNQSLTLCENFYNINDTELNGVIIINASNIILDCNNATLNGTGTGYGIYNTGFNDVTLKNCKITNYVYGIYVNDSNLNNILNNEISNNCVGTKVSHAKIKKGMLQRYTPKFLFSFCS